MVEHLSCSSVSTNNLIVTFINWVKSFTKLKCLRYLSKWCANFNGIHLLFLALSFVYSGKAFFVLHTASSAKLLIPWSLRLPNIWSFIFAARFVCSFFLFDSDSSHAGGIQIKCSLLNICSLYFSVISVLYIWCLIRLNAKALMAEKYITSYILYKEHMWYLNNPFGFQLHGNCHWQTEIT